jgi:hypothetical protein
MTTTVDATPAAAVAAYGLPGTFHSFPEQSLDTTAWTTLRGRVRAQRLSGLLLAAIDEGALPATDEQREEVADDHIECMGSALVLEDLLLTVVAELNRAQIPYRVLKGCAVAQLDYRSPDLRIFGDLDLMVPAAHFDAAVQLLTGLGYVRPFTPPRAGWERRFGKGASFRAGDGREIDLHRTFCTGPFAVRADLDDVWAEPAETYVLGRDLVAALPRELRLLNAAYAAVLGDRHPPLPTLRDIAELALHPDLDTARVLDLAARWRGEAVLATAVVAAWAQLRVADVTALSTWAERYRPSVVDQRALALYHAAGVTETTRALATAWAMPHLGTRVAYLWGLARADSRFAAPSQRGSLRRITHAVGRLRQLRGEA